MQKQLTFDIKAFDLVPPVSNTGAQTTGQRILIDWFAFTLPFDADIYTVLGIPGNEWVPLQTKTLGYSTMYLHGDMRVYTSEREDMGIHCELSGNACRAYEFFMEGKWADLIQRIRENNGHFSRIDLAVDDFDGLFSLKDIEQKILAGEVVSYFRKSRILKEYSLGQQDNLGETIYFGSPQSRIRVRIYDKAIETLLKEQASKEADAITKESKAKVPKKIRQENKQLREENYRQERLNLDQVWLRTEIQSRDQRAEMIANYIFTESEVGKIAFGILKNYINFVEHSDTDSRKCRWQTSNFWTKFLGEVEKLKLTTEKQKRTIKQVKDWIVRQVAPSLALLSLDKNLKANLEQVCEITMLAMNRLKKSHYQMVLAS